MKVLLWQRKKRGIWYYRYVDASGKAHRKSLGTYDKGVAEELRKEIEARLTREQWGIPAVLTNVPWETARDEFLAHHRAVSRAQTATTYERHLKAVETLLAPTLVRDVAAGVEAFKQKRLATKVRNRAVTATTVNRDLRTVRSFCRWCVDRGYLLQAPKITLIRENQKRPKQIAATDVAKLLAAAQSAPVKRRSNAWWSMFLLLAYRTGARLNELLELPWSQVDLANRSVTFTAETSKGRRDKAIPLSEETCVALREWRGQSGDKKLVLPWDTSKTRRALYDDLELVFVQAGVPYSPPKHLRSTAGSEWVQAGVPTVVVRDLLGHSTVVTTEKHYTDTAGAMRGAVEKRESEFGL